MIAKTLPFQTIIHEQLKEVEQHMLAQADHNHPDLATALEHLVAAGGKRVRPMVTLLVGGMLGADSQRLHSLAAAVEMLHTATLVHDDLIDGALLRRGMTTLNAKWSPAATVLTGDFIFARAAKLAADTDSIGVMHMFADALTTIVNGEITQYFDSRGVANRENYFHRIYAKTASMFELAAGAAALLSPVDEGVTEAAHRFGYEIGMAFQIMDDVLDFTGEQVTVGKPVASDLRQGLITLPALHYWEAYPNDPAMKSVINRNGHSNQEFSDLVHAIRHSGAIEKALEEASQYVQSAQNILASFPAAPERAALSELTQYIVHRQI